MKQDSSFSKSRELPAKEAKPMRRESQQVMSDLIRQLRKQLDGERVAGPDAEQDAAAWDRPNLDSQDQKCRGSPKKPRIRAIWNRS